MVASVVLLGAIVTGGVMLFSGDDENKNTQADRDKNGPTAAPATPGSSQSPSQDEESKDEGEGEQKMKLTTPKTLDGGAYTMDKDREGLKKEGVAVGESQAGAEYVVARYKGSSSATSVLMLEGAYGLVGDQEKARSTMFKNFEGSGGGTQIIGGRRTFRPSEAKGTEIECELSKSSSIGYAPVCTWADSSTAAIIAYANAKFSSASDVNLSQYADTTAVIRNEVRKPM
ncbi:hypothetical protein [Streptomyces sp. MST-110588]|uniref:hypothetical protein n=1 Tax=Streptomyces sp. MST-110588 TaxID=2833628 RepID=UPI001F5C21B4|nr:hypothetical protein [Streptomyces sp. MST-110588]UNO42006.1 hypothetical protein KGS77_23865 [Streptomyces sp. MST-110588]